jgi:pimeloyl-ACP methyl ester carboxylesterase
LHAGIAAARRCRLALLLLLAVVFYRPSLSPSLAQKAGPAFTPVPCPTMDWIESDPAFTALPNAQAFFGSYDGGLYRIEIPTTWNGDLVLAAHGFTSTAGPNGTVLSVGFESPQASFTFAPGLDPSLRSHLIANGFAWAASSYRCNGYIPGIGLQDTLLLRDVFLQKTGGVAPKHTFLIGLSMGGHIVDLGLQEFPTAFDGGIAFCAASAGEFDYLNAAGAAAEVVTGLQFTTPDQIAQTVQQMTDLLGMHGSYTPLGEALGSVKIHITGGPRPFAVEGVNAMFGDTFSGSMLSGATDPYTRSATNEFVQYDIAPGFGFTADQLNATVRRVAPDWSLRGPAGPYAETQPWTGRIQRPLLTIHDTGDFYVPINQEQALFQAVAGAGNSDLLVQRVVRAAGHCNFSAQEVIQTFDDGIAWFEQGVRPAGDDILGDLNNAGLKFTNPLRADDPGTLDFSPSAATGH